MEGHPTSTLFLAAPLFAAQVVLWPRVTPAYAAALGLIALYWLVRVVREARAGRTLRVAWWSLPGLLLLLLAPVQEQPTFFALGAFLLLVAEFWRGAYRPVRTRPGWLWPLLGAVLGLALLWSTARHAGPSRLALVAPLALLVSGVAALSSAAAWRGPRSLPVNTTWPRWAAVAVPEWPDLSVTLTGRGAELKNISREALSLAGWSPAQVNGWLLVRDAVGHPVQVLRPNETALLPLNDLASGVRVWYRTGTGSQPLLFRADWTPARYQAGRVLN